MIDAAHVIVGVQGVPTARFVGVNDRTERNMTTDRRDCVAFLGAHEGKRAALAFAHDDDHLALAGLFLGKAAIDAINDFIFRLPMAAEICAVDFLFGLVGECRLLLIGLDRLAEFVRKDESRFVRYYGATATRNLQVASPHFRA